MKGFSAFLILLTVLKRLNDELYAFHQTDCNDVEHRFEVLEIFLDRKNKVLRSDEEFTRTIEALSNKRRDSQITTTFVRPLRS